MHNDDDFEDEDFGHELDDSVESQVWQLLMLINPGDEEMALQQFAAYRERFAEADADAPMGLEMIPVEVIGEVIDWRSGFMVDPDDLLGLMQAVDELCARWNLAIDWGGDPDDDGFFNDLDAAELCSMAYDQLAQSGYMLWAWETADDRLAGWMTLTRDAEPLRELATALHINLRRGSEVG